MKKAKLFLTAVTVLAVVGGAFAFKAHVNGQFLYTEDPANPGSCTVATGVKYILDDNGQEIFSKLGTPGTCVDEFVSANQ